MERNERNDAQSAPEAKSASSVVPFGNAKPSSQIDAPAVAKPANEPRPDAEAGSGPGASTTDLGANAGASRRAWVRATLIQEYRLASALIGVPKLALIMGLSPSTIWSHMRQRKFPIPYRMVNTTPMVGIDDLVDWYCARDDLIFPAEADAEPTLRASPRDEAEEERKRRDDDTDAIVNEALAKLGIPPRRRRRQ
jgi:DNA-binding CsgD family transcriptional regulator